MRESISIAHLKRMYPECSHKELMNLVEAIRAKKYWSVCPSKKDAFYVVALSRAETSSGNYFARVTHLGQVMISKDAAQYCRNGRVLVVASRDSKFVAKSVTLWPAFLKMIRLKAETVYEMLKADKLPPFVNHKVITDLKARMT